MVDLNHCDFTGFEPIFIWNESLSTRQSWIGNRLTSTKNIRLSIRITFLQNNTNEIEKEKPFENAIVHSSMNAKEHFNNDSKQFS